MAWTSPRTWVSGEVLTAALLNLHLRDNLRYLDAEVVADPFGTMGITAGTDATITELDVSRAGRLVMLSVYGTYTGAAQSVPTSGNITNIPILTIGNTGWRPIGTTGASSTFSGRGFFGGINTSGSLQLTAVSGSAAVATNETFQMSATYIKAAP